MQESFYQDSIVLLEGVVADMLARIEVIRKYQKHHNDRDPIKYLSSRIKTEESMKSKLERKGFPVTLESALTNVYDAAGIRIVCPYLDDVYDIAKMIVSYSDLRVIAIKDYIQNPKPNGYRSYHIIVQIDVSVPGPVKSLGLNLSNNQNVLDKYPVYLEIQLRTMAMDFWSSLEHQIKYKKDIANADLIGAELKRCAELITTTDMNMQTIRQLIETEGGKKAVEKDKNSSS